MDIDTVTFLITNHLANVFMLESIDLSNLKGVQKRAIEVMREGNTMTVNELVAYLNSLIPSDSLFKAKLDSIRANAKGMVNLTKLEVSFNNPQTHVDNVVPIEKAKRSRYLELD